MSWKDKNEPWEINNESWSGDNGPWDFSKTKADHFYNEGNLVSSSYDATFDIYNHAGDSVTDNHDPCGYWFNISTDAIIDRTDDDSEDSGYGPKQPSGQGGDSDIPCYDVPPIIIDLESSVSEMAPETDETVVVSYGVDEKTVIIDGVGFWLDRGFTLKTLQYVGSNFIVYTDATACGSAYIEVSDRCSEATHYILSTIGQWVTVPNGAEIYGQVEASEEYVSGLGDSVWNLVGYYNPILRATQVWKDRLVNLPDWPFGELNPGYYVVSTIYTLEAYDWYGNGLTGILNPVPDGGGALNGWTSMEAAIVEEWVC